MLRTLLVLTLFHLCICVLAGDEWASFRTSQLSEDGQRAYNQLAGATAFSTGGFGAAGVVSKSESALKIMLEDEYAVEALKRLIVFAEPAGQVYALCGLHLLDADAFKEAAKRLKTSKARVSVEQLSCIVEGSESVKTMQEMIRSIEKGDYDAYFTPDDRKKKSKTEANPALQRTATRDYVAAVCR